MKKLIIGIILTLGMLVPFIDKITSDADSQQDWMLGIGIIILVSAFALWLTARAERSDIAAEPASAAVSRAPATASNTVRSEAFVPSPAAVPLCAVCGAPSTGTKFCTQCGKLFQPRNSCSQCGTQLQSGIKFCPECGRKVR